MHRSWVTACLGLLLPLSGLAAEAGYLRLKRVEIVDRHGFEKPMTAMSLLIPTAWTFDGEVRFAQRLGDPADLVKLAFRAASPDGRLAIQRQNAMAAQLGKAPTEMLPPMAAREFLTRVAVPRLRPAAKVLGTEPIPDLEQALQAQVKEAQAMALRAGVQMRLRADQARARIQLAQSAEDTRRTLREGYEARQKSEDRNAERWSDAMRGLQTYRNPATGEDVKLDNSYAHAWASGNGEYVLSDAPGFNPGQVLKGNWTELQPVHH